MGRERPNPSQGPRRPSRLRPALDTLEPRLLCRITGMKVGVFPTQEPAPTGRYTTLAVQGVLDVSNKDEPAPTFNYTVFDDYRENQRQPTRVELVRSDLGDTWWQFTFVINLKANVSIHSNPGHHYYIVLAARDVDAPFGKVVPILVPSAPLTRGGHASAAAHVPAGPRALRHR
jgi:hypothetical protein